MASSAKLTALFLLTLLFIQIHARESHFFSKIPNNNNNGQTQIPNKVLDPALTNSEKTTTTPQDQEPNFIPQTQDNGYGLYGHESGQLPPNSDAKFSDPTAGRPFTTTTTYDNDNNYRRSNDALSYNSESEDHYYNNYNQNFQNGNSKKPYENSFYYNKDLYDNGRQSFQNTRLSRDDYTTTTPSYDDDNNFYFNNNNGRDNGNNVARQGMSDTRFMEDGKYFYDLHREPHHYSTSRGNFGHNHYNYNNNGNTFEHGNSMGRYQNDEAEFQEESDDFVP